jgi:hypothetical protein
MFHLPQSASAFLAALVGSLLREAIVANKEFRDNRDQLPSRYSNITYYLLRAALAIAAALTAVVLAGANFIHSIPTPLLGLIIGIAPDPIFRHLTRIAVRQLFPTDDPGTTPPPTINEERNEIAIPLTSHGNVSDELKKVPKKPPSRVSAKKKPSSESKSQEYQQQTQD